MLFMYCCPYIVSSLEFPGAELAKTVPEQDIRGGIWLIGWLCERAFRSRLTLRKEGEVAWLESPNGLGATAESQLRGEVSTTRFRAILCRRRDARQQSKWLALHDLQLTPSLSSNRHDGDCQQ